jgi:hypothetical protein
MTTYEDHEMRKEKIRSELYARVKTSVKPHFLTGDGMTPYYRVEAKTHSPGTMIFVMRYTLTLEEYNKALADLSILDGYREQCVTALHSAVDRYCANLGEEDDKVLS